VESWRKGKKKFRDTRRGTEGESTKKNNPGGGGGQESLSWKTGVDWDLGTGGVKRHSDQGERRGGAEGENSLGMREVWKR